MTIQAITPTNRQLYQALSDIKELKAKVFALEIEIKKCQIILAEISPKDRAALFLSPEQPK